MATDLIAELLSLANCDARAGEPLGKVMREAADTIARHRLQSTTLPSFDDAWAKKVAEGYRYGQDALDNVRFGYEIARAELAALAKGEGR